MNTLKFDSQFVPSILDGTKYATWHINDNTNYNVDDLVNLINNENQQLFGYGLIKEVVIKHLGSLNNNDIDGHEQYADDNEMYETFRKYYGHSVDSESVVTIIKFKLVDKLQTYDELKTKQLIDAKLYTDGGSRGNPGPSASGVVILDLDNNVVKKTGEYLGITTNNQAEYRAVLLGLQTAQQLGIKNLDVYMDSLLIVNQMLGKYKIKSPDLLPIFENIHKLVLNFNRVSFTHIPRELNKLADQQVNDILDAQ
jgi:ribonuclease HI